MIHVEKKLSPFTMCGAALVEGDTLVPGATQSDCVACRVALKIGPLIHIIDYKQAPGSAICKAVLVKGDTLVEGARQSDCDNCRGALLIAPVKDMPVKPLPDYKPEPYADLESLESIRARRDGR